MRAFKSIGVEVELFLTKNSLNKFTIFNASKELEKILGFNIQPVGYAYADGGHLQIDYNTRLTTDGTPIEYQTFFETRYTPNTGTKYTLNRFLSKIEKVNSTLFKDYDVSWDCLYNQVSSYFFDSPNNIYSSGKDMRNAYTGLNFTVNKKDEIKSVTNRTAGLHIHLELTNHDINNPLITDKLIKEIDRCYFLYFHPQTYMACARDNSIIKGDYRIKMQSNNIKTLEYRQLIPQMLKSGELYHFLCHIDDACMLIK